MRKPVSAFRIRTRKTPRPRSQCKICEARTQRIRQRQPETQSRRKKVKLQWERNNPEKYRRMVVRRSLRAKGCPESDLNEWIERYLHAEHCDICGLKPNNGRWRSLHIDHCHQTGTIRGFLCDNCNLGLGKFKDCPDLLLAAANYISVRRKLAPSQCQ